MSRKSFIGNEDDDDWETFDENDIDEVSCEFEEEPKDKHGISILMNVNSKDAGVIRDALIKAQQMGIYVVLATGRPIFGIRKYIDELQSILEEYGINKEIVL